MQYISKTYSINNNFNSIGDYGFMFNDFGFTNKYDSYESVSYYVSKGGFIHYYPCSAQKKNKYSAPIFTDGSVQAVHL